MLSEKLQEMIKEELALLEAEIKHRLEEEHEVTYHILMKELELYSWIKLPEYPLMQYQKDAINEAIETICSGQLEF